MESADKGVKPGDRVRVKTEAELDASGVDYRHWGACYRDLIGKEATVLSVNSDQDVSLTPGSAGMFRPIEYVRITREHIVRGDLVLVSNLSEKDARNPSKARKAVFLAYIKGARAPYICTTPAAYGREPFVIQSWKVAVKQPVKQKLTKAELIEFLEEHGMELED